MLPSTFSLVGVDVLKVTWSSRPSSDTRSSNSVSTSTFSSTLGSYPPIITNFTLDSRCGHKLMIRSLLSKHFHGFSSSQDRLEVEEIIIFLWNLFLWLFLAFWRFSLKSTLTTYNLELGLVFVWRCEKKIGLRKNRSLPSLYDSWYDPPWDCLHENIGKNRKSYQMPEDKLVDKPNYSTNTINYEPFEAHCNFSEVPTFRVMK